MCTSSPPSHGGGERHATKSSRALGNHDRHFDRKSRLLPTVSRQKHPRTFSSHSRRSSRSFAGLSISSVRRSTTLAIVLADGGGDANFARYKIVSSVSRRRRWQQKRRYQDFGLRKAIIAATTMIESGDRRFLVRGRARARASACFAALCSTKKKR